MFCAQQLIFGGVECVGSRFHVFRGRSRFQLHRGRGVHFYFLRSRTHFRRFRGRRFPFSCFVRTSSFSAVTRASGPIFMICAPGHIFGGTSGVGSRFHVLRARSRFQRYRGRGVPFSLFARPHSCSAVPRASGPVFMFCAHELIFGGNEGVGSRFHVLRALTHFQRYRGRRIPFSCFARSDSFSAVSSALDPVFIFCAPVLVFSDIEGVWSRFHVLHTRSRFKGVSRRGSRFHVLRPDTFSAVTRASGPVLMFCAPRLVFVVTEGVGLIFMFCASRLIFCCTEGVGSRLHVLHSRTHFQLYRSRRVPFSCFA
jgi:hypothetical protein